MFKFFEAFQKGKALTNSVTLKNIQTTTNALIVVISFIVSVANLFFDFHITNEQIIAVSGGIAGIANVIITNITSEKVGLPQKSEPPES
jgi:hypothetical protein